MTAHHFRRLTQLQRYGFVALALFFFFSYDFAQVSNKVSKVDVGSIRAGQPITVTVELISSTGYSRIELAYRPFGTQDYKRLEMQVSNTVAVATIPAQDAAPPYVEYFVLLYPENTPTAVTYPQENPETQPLRTVIPQSTELSSQITMLSPDPNESTNADEVLISFSLLRADSSVDRAATKVYLDGADLSSQVVRSEDLFVLRPDNSSVPLTPGSHSVLIVLYDTKGNIYQTYNQAIAVSSGTATGGPASVWTSNASMQLETRNENVGGSVQPYNRATMAASTSDGTYKFNGRVFVTNEEKNYRQPQHRYFISGESPWLKLGYGDSYPTFPSLVLNGKRVRGFAGNLLLGFFNLDVTSGEVTRPIEGITIKTFSRDSLAAEQQRDPTAAFGPIDSLTYGKFQYGTYARNILVLRPSFGKKDKTQFGFTYLKSKDDIGSIQYGIRPEENLVLGSDLTIALDNRNFELIGQVAFSATNKDISKGTMTDADIDSTFKDPNYSDSDRKNIRQARDILDRFITFNNNLVPLSIKNLATLSYEGGISLNYFNNLFRANYIRHGNSYESFGRTSLNTDVAGYQFSDRLALAQNRVYVSGAFENLKDNTAETKAATTTYRTFNAAISYISRSNVPSMTVGYLNASNTNGLQNSSSAVDDATNRVFVQLGHTFTLGTQQDATLNVSTSKRDDNTARDMDSRTTTISLSALTTYRIPLQTSASITYMSNEFGPSTGSTAIKYTTIYANAIYRFAEPNLRLMASINPTFGDIKRTVMEAGAQYFFTKNLSAQTQLTRYFNSGITNDLIWSFILRLDV